MKDPRAFLGVEHSTTGRRWVGLDAGVERNALAIIQQTGVPDLVGRVLAARGVTPENARDYLNPTLRDLMPDPSVIADMDVAASRLARAVKDKERIAVFGDYDVDGAASAALVIDWLHRLGLDADFHIPDRITEGYGPNTPRMERLAQSHSLILCVDCGTMGHEPIAAARAAGAEVIVADHHMADEILPQAIVVNPNRADDGSDMGYLCAAGVVFMLLVAVNRILRLEGWFNAQRPPPDMMAALDLVAIATVADMAPLIGLNRALVRQGLRVMAGRRRAGLAALADIAGLSAPPSSRDLGYALGPRLNAGGRIGASDLGVRLLLARDEQTAAAFASKLDSHNRERREIESAVLEAAMEQAAPRGADALVWAAGEGWHPGVIGIVASRLKDHFNRPAMVVALADGVGKGSGRSVPGIDLGAAVARLTRMGVFTQGGGHRMAAGITVDAAQLDTAMTMLADLLQPCDGAIPAAAHLRVDGAIAPGAATVELVEQLEAAGPFGQANPAPRVVCADVIPKHVRVVGKGHYQLRLQGRAGASVSAIAFRAAERGLAEMLDSAAGAGRVLHVAGRLERDDWGGRRQAKLQIDDLAEMR